MINFIVLLCVGVLCLANDLTVSGGVVRLMTDAEQARYDAVKAQQAKVDSELVAAESLFTTRYNRFWELYHAHDERTLTTDELVELAGLGVWLAGTTAR